MPGQVLVVDGLRARWRPRRRSLILDLVRAATEDQV